MSKSKKRPDNRVKLDEAKLIISWYQGFRMRDPSAAEKKESVELYNKICGMFPSLKELKLYRHFEEE